MKKILLLALALVFSKNLLAAPPVIWDSACSSGIFNLANNSCLVSGGSGAVNSVFGRSGNVTASSADYSAYYLLKSNNLSDLSSASTARTNLGLGTAATQNLSAFLQPSNNLSDLVSASTARTNLGLGTASTQNVSAFLQPSNNLSDVASVSSSRTSLGLPSTISSGDVMVGTPSGTYSPVPIGAANTFFGVLPGGTTIGWQAAPGQGVTSNTVYVSTLGNDTSGNGSINLPYATVCHAMAAITTATMVNRFVIRLQAGQYSDPCTVGSNVLYLKPWVWITGEGMDVTQFRINNGSTGSITLDPTWATLNSNGFKHGISNLTIYGATPMTLNYNSAMSGNPSSNRTVVSYFNNMLTQGSITVTGQASGLVTAFNMIGSVVQGAFSMDSTYGAGTFLPILQGSQFESTAAFNASVGQMVGYMVADYFNSGVTIANAGNFNSSYQLDGSAFNSTLSATGSTSASTTITGSVAGFPSNRSFDPYITSVFISGSNALLYSPTVTANWPSNPATVQNALDQIPFLPQSAVGSQPACTSLNRGLTWLIQSATGTADIFQICSQTSSGFSWVTH